MHPRDPAARRGVHRRGADGPRTRREERAELRRRPAPAPVARESDHHRELELVGPLGGTRRPLGDRAGVAGRQRTPIAATFMKMLRAAKWPRKGE